jgi:hypothetical protein
MGPTTLKLYSTQFVKLLALLYEGVRSGRLGMDGGEGGKSGGEGEGKVGRVRVMLEIQRSMAGVGVGDGGDGEMS